MILSLQMFTRYGLYPNRKGFLLECDDKAEEDLKHLWEDLS